MTDLAAEWTLLAPQILPAVQAALASGQYVHGPNVRAFEQEIAHYLGVRHAIGVASGTDALMLALRAAGVGPGDEVITTPFSFIATASAIAMVGATPVFADIDPLTFNLDAAQAQAAIGARTRAIVPVHLYGQAADLRPLLALCARHGLALIEDCAQALGADYEGRKLGAWGHAACLSFYPSKTLGGFGDGGMVVTDDDALAERVRMLANHGSRTRYLHETLGFNSRLDELQAAVLRIKLRHLDEFNRRRRENARRYREALTGLPLQLPVETGAGVHVYGQYTIASAERDRLRAALEREGIGCAIHYPIALHRQPLWRNAYDGARARGVADVAMQGAIDPTAIVDAGARLGSGVRVGPYAVIEADTEVGDGCIIAAHAVVKRYTRLGRRNRICEHAVIGGEPQDLKFGGGASYVMLGDDNVVRVGVTIHRSSRAGGATRIGNGCLLMAYAHVAHDCELADGVIVANGTAIGGHVRIGERAFLSGLVAVHQFCRIGRLAMVGAGARIVQDCLPFVITEGHPGRARALNLVGLRRAGFDAGALLELKRTFRLLRSGLPLAELLARLDALSSALAREVADFIRGSQRGFARPGGRATPPAALPEA